MSDKNNTLLRKNSQPLTGSAKLDTPKLIVVSAPSGGGKTTICHKLSERNPNFRFSVSATTRPRRPGEKDGVDYFFLSREEFERKIRNDEFLEYEEVFGNLYGTLKSYVRQLLREGHSVLLDIDVKGALQIKSKFPQAVLIFILPPSTEELRKRLLGRKTDDPKEIEKRLKRLPLEYQEGKKFDYQVVNDRLEEAVEQIEKILVNH